MGVFFCKCPNAAIWRRRSSFCSWVADVSSKPLEDVGVPATCCELEDVETTPGAVYADVVVWGRIALEVAIECAIEFDPSVPIPLAWICVGTFALCC